MDQSGEELTVLLTMAPIEGLEIAAKRLRMGEAQVAEWEQKWGASKPSVFELTGGAAQPWSRAEQMAAGDKRER